MDSSCSEIFDVRQLFTSRLQVPIEHERKNELKAIIYALENDRDLIISGAPGSGRFSLVKKAVETVDAQLLSVECFKANKGNEFICLIIESIYFAFGEDNRRLFNEIILSLSQNDNLFGTCNKRGKVWVEPFAHLDLKNQEKAFQIAIGSIQQLSEQVDSQAVLLLKHFYHIRSWDRNGNWERFLKMKVCEDSKVSYIILGTVSEAVVDDSVATGKDLNIVELRPLPKEVIKTWVLLATEKKGMTFSSTDDALDLFLETVRGHIGEARTLIKHVFLACDFDKEITKNDVLCAISSLLEDFEATFESILLTLPYSQLQLLESLAIEPTAQPHRQDYLRKHGLSRGGKLQAALKGLQQKELIYDSSVEYQLTLPLLAYWLKKTKTTRENY